MALVNNATLLELAWGTLSPTDRNELGGQRRGTEARMTKEDPKLPRYGELTIEGATLDDLAPVLERHLRPPWARATEIEESWQERESMRDQPAVFRREAGDGLPGAHLYLFAREDGSLYVSNVVPTESGQLSEVDYNGLLEDFHDVAVVPAADELGIRPELDLAEYDLAERAGAEVRDALARFSRAANKSTGASHPMDAERFDDFVIETASLDPYRRPAVDAIAEWLVADGWSDDIAWDLALQYERGLRLLDRKSHHG